jgi:hypothetical protein
MVVRWASEPLPTLPSVTPCPDFAAVSTSWKFLYGFCAPVVMAIGAVPMIMTGSKSLSGSNVRLGLSA